MQSRPCNQHRPTTSSIRNGITIIATCIHAAWNTDLKTQEKQPYKMSFGRTPLAVLKKPCRWTIQPANKHLLITVPVSKQAYKLSRVFSCDVGWPCKVGVERKSTPERARTCHAIGNPAKNFTNRWGSNPTHAERWPCTLRFPLDWSIDSFMSELV